MLPRDGPPPVIFGILSFPDETLQQECESSGMHGVLTKPINKVDLEQKIRISLAPHQDCRVEHKIERRTCEGSSQLAFPDLAGQGS